MWTNNKVELVLPVTSEPFSTTFPALSPVFGNARLFFCLPSENAKKKTKNYDLFK